MSASATTEKYLPLVGWSFVFGLPLTVFFARVLPVPSLNALVSGLTLADLPPQVLAQVGFVLAIPLGAIVVVVARVTLGLRLMGPFRPILIAVALQMTGIMPGLLFLVAVSILIALVRPLVRAMKLPYFARTATTLSIVALFSISVLLVGKWFDIAALTALAHFPIVVLCLAAEAFARTISGEGLYSAAWRGMLTAATALLITLIITTPGVLPVLVRHPELVLLEVGIAALIGRYFAFRALDHLNPKPVKKKKKKTAPRRHSRGQQMPARKTKRKVRKTPDRQYTLNV